MIHGLLPQQKIPSSLPEAPWFGDGLSALRVFLNQICVAPVVIPVLGGQVQEAVLSAVRMRNIQKFSTISTTTSPSTAFLSKRPSGEHPKPALSVPLGSQVGGKS